MASNPELTREWIQFLKNNRIVGMQSDPETGQLKYNRKVTTDDVRTFLQSKTDFDDKSIENAIQSVASKPRPAAPTPDLPATQQQVPPGAPTQQVPPSGEPPKAPSAKPKKFSTDDATDVEYRDIRPQARIGTSVPPTPAAPEEPKRKPRFKYRYKTVKEAMQDEPAAEMSEKDIEQIFSMLSQPKAKAKKGAEAQMPQRDPQEVRREEVNKIKRLIRDSMNEQQRMALWRALTNA